MQATLKPAFHPALKPLIKYDSDFARVGVMYLKKVAGPRAVTLPDGQVMTRADLPPADTRRWVASRKAAVVRAVVYGLVSQEEAQERYAISAEEFLEWVSAVANHGEEALKATALQKFRQP